MNVEAFNEKNKKEVMRTIENIATKERLKQRELASLFGIKQPRVSDLIGGKHERFSLDILLVYLAKLGYQLDLKQQADVVRGKPLKATITKVETNFDSVL